MTMAATLVSGGTGFVGRFIVERLLAEGHVVTVLGRTPPVDGFFSRPMRFVEGSLEPTRDCSATFEGADFFVHAAFDHLPGRYRGGEGADPDGFWRKNHDGSVALFETAKRSGIKRAVFLSSRAVYGGQAPGALLAEGLICFPETHYGKAKLATETALRELGGPDFATTSLRATGVYGPAGSGQTHKWHELLDDYLAGRAIEPRAGSEVHGEDVAAAVALVLAAPCIPSAVFNVSDLVVDRRGILAIAKENTGSPHPLPEATDASFLNVMATDRIRALGWRPGGALLFRKTVEAMVAERLTVSPRLRE